MKNGRYLTLQNRGDFCRCPNGIILTPEYKALIKEKSK